MCRMDDPRQAAAGRAQVWPVDARLRALEAEDAAVPSHYDNLLGISFDSKAFGCSADVSEPLSIHWVEGAIIVGAGPAGLATAACLGKAGISSVVLERENCIGSLWRYRTYNRLRLHIAKQFCELPYMPFPSSFPTFPTREQFLEYLDEYAQAFGIMPQFNENVMEATYCQGTGLWWVESRGPQGHRTFVGRWLVAATGENAQPLWPEVPGLGLFNGKLFHSSEYKSGEDYCGKRVLVVGGGNSGLEVALDLANHHADVCLSVRSQVHVLPREVFGFSTFAVAMTLLKFFSLQWTDRLLLLLSRIILGKTDRLGFSRPSMGPMEMKGKTGKTPSLDAGTLSKIREGCIEVFPEVEKFDQDGCFFLNSSSCVGFDAVILATGFRSNVPSWLKENELFSAEGFPKSGSPSIWKGENGLYTAGFSRKGLLGVAKDAQNIAADISKLYHRVQRWL